MPLKLNGKTFCLNPPSPTLIRIKSFLDKLPKDEILDIRELSTRLGRAISHVATFSPEIPEYTMRVGKNRYFGNPVAIKQLRKQVEAGS